MTKETILGIIRAILRTLENDEITQREELELYDNLSYLYKEVGENKLASQYKYLSLYPEIYP